MSITEQLLDDMKDLIPIKPQWKKISDEYPDPSKIKYIFAWHKIERTVKFLRSVGIIWICQDGYYHCDNDTTPHHLKSHFSSWYEAELGVPPEDCQ